MDKEMVVLRELLRRMVRDLGILEKNDTPCCGVTLSQCHTIVEIGRKEEISLGDLSDIMGLDKSTMSRTINNLVTSDLVVRDLDAQNRRYVKIQLTDKGRSVCCNIEENMDAYYLEIFNAIPEEKRTSVLESLKILSEAIIGQKSSERVEDERDEYTD